MNALASVDADDIPDGEEVRSKQLVSSIVQRAVMDWIQYRLTDRPERRIIYQEAHAWLFEEDHAIYDAWGITFPAACQVLNIGLHWFRRELPRQSTTLLALLPAEPDSEDLGLDVLDD